MFEIFVISLATAFCVFGNLQNDRKIMLLCGVLCAATFSVFWCACGEMTALGITIAAMTGTLIQLLIPASLLQKTYWARFTFTLALAAGVFAFTYHSPIDALPVIGFAGARLAETFSRPQLIRCGYQFSGGLWLLFCGLTGNIPGVVSNVIVLTAQSYALLRDWGALAKPLVPVTVKGVA